MMAWRSKTPGAITLLAAALWAGASGAQNFGTPLSQILILDSEKAYLSSTAGQRITKELEASLDALVAENRRIEAELTAEELDLTEKRQTMEPDAFRDLADAFDQKVQLLRDEQDSKQLELQRLRDVERQAFIEAMTPIISSIAVDHGALIILERRNVLLAADSIDITDAVIARINAAFIQEVPDQSAGEDRPPDQIADDDDNGNIDAADE